MRTFSKALNSGSKRWNWKTNLRWVLRNALARDGTTRSCFGLNGNLVASGIKRAQDLKKGGFAGTRRAHNAHNLACIHSQVHPAENLQLPKPFDDVRGLNHA